MSRITNHIYKLELINTNMNKDVYDMYQDIPKEELGSNNPFYGLTFEEYKDTLINIKKDETIIDSKLNTTTNRYIFFVNDNPVGELGIRTTLNDFLVNKGSQVFYKIRISERNKGHGNKILELGLEECKKLGMKKVRINCADTNEASKKVIIHNSGKLDIISYKTNDGTSSSYIIDLDNN
jgi:predicted acetyltransferase